ncbi:hypothetical protein [Streptomyces sp. NPDC091268]|uniref:hypothetical protein n=1 Tax=Streptomyces sp. NPDC091268 TaxID=3365979 RepID=UPI00381B3733
MARAALEPWVHGLVNSILYTALYHGGGLPLDGDALVRKYALALQVDPISDRSLPEQVAGLRAAALCDTPLVDAFPPYPGQRPFAESEFRDFLVRLADEVAAQAPWPQARPPRPSSHRPPPAPRSWLRRLRRR